MATQYQKHEINNSILCVNGDCINGNAEIHDHHINEETNNPKPETSEPAIEEMDIALATYRAGPKNHHPPSSQLLSNNTLSFSSTEKDDTMLKTLRGDGTLNQIDTSKSLIRMVRVKKKRATRPSLDAFFQKAAAAAAARLERRPNTRHGGRRDGTHFSTNGEIKKAGEASVGHGSNSISSTNSLSGKNKKNGKRAYRKRKNSRGTEEDGHHSKKAKTAPIPARGPAAAPTNNAAKATYSAHANMQKNVDLETNDVLQVNTSTHTVEGGSTESFTPNLEQSMHTHEQLPASLKYRKKPSHHKAHKPLPLDRPFVDLPYRPDNAPEDDFPPIPMPRAGDVLFGRGSSIALHYGNIQFRGMVLDNKDRYLACSRYNKSDVARELVDVVAQRGGRFLELDVNGTVFEGPWRQASYSKSVEKTCQALRENKWGAINNTPSPQKNFVIPIEDPESIPDKPSPRTVQRSPPNVPTPAAEAERSTESTSTSTTSSPPPPVDAPYDDNSTSGSTLSKSVDEEEQEEDLVASMVANANVGDSNTASAVEEHMNMLHDGSRVAIYWPLDFAYYEGTVEDRLQDNFFYVRYDDGESEWLDLTKHAFKVISAAPAPPARQPAPAHSKLTTAKTKARRGGKKESGTTSEKKTDRSNGKKKESNGKKKKEEKDESRTIGDKNPAIRTSAQRNKQVMDAIKKHGTEDWEAIATEVPGWTAEDCKRRWDLYLDPTISRRDPFTEEEIREILSFQANEGNEWTLLVPRLNRRCPGHISDRWNRKFRKIVVDFLQNLGFTLDEIEGDEKKRINYQGYLEGAVEAIMSTIV